FSWSRVLLTGTIPGDGYFLVRLNAAATGNELPMGFDQTSNSISAAAVAGKFALVDNTTTLTVSCPTVGIIDFVGYGTGTNCFEGAGVAPSLSTTTAGRRAGFGCTDTNNNSADFTAVSHATGADFRNSASAPDSECVSGESDLGITLTNPFVCDVAPGTGTLTYTVTISNGAADLGSEGVVGTITLPAGVTFTGGTASNGSLAAGPGNTVVWSAGTVPLSTTYTATLTCDVAGGGAITATASVTGSGVDLFANNNNASKSNFIAAPSGATLQRVLITNNPGGTAAARLATVPTGTRTWSSLSTASSNVFARFGGSADGTKFSFAGQLDGSDPTNDRALFIGDATLATPTWIGVVQKGTTSLAPDLAGENAGATLDGQTFVNNAGQLAFSGASDPATTNDDYVARRNADGTINVLVREGAALPAGIPSAVTWGATNEATGITTAGNVSFRAALAGAGTSGLNNSMFGLATNAATVTTLARLGTAPNIDGSGIVAGDTNTMASLFTAESFGYTTGCFIAADGVTWMLGGLINGPATTANDVLVRTGATVIQEGKALPGDPVGAGVTAGTFSGDFSMSPAGDWVSFAATSAATNNDVVLRNGAFYTRTGDPIFTGSTEVWSDTNPTSPGGTAGFTATFFSVYTNGADTIIAGISDEPTRRSNGVMVWNNTAVIVREGDPVDLNANGIADDNAFVNTIRDGRTWIDAQRRAYIQVSLRDSNFNCTPNEIGHAVILISLPSLAAARCNPADIAADDGQFLARPAGSNTPAIPGTTTATNNGVTESDYNVFFANFFDAFPVCDIANDSGDPLPPFGTFDTNNGVTEGDYNRFFAIFFDGCAF
ncbi:MAG: DUF11 domain-containing protein, partial [Phycisphaerales bacterium]|nr:DUF11 domain-containing protein [Phycisphaerales bacterium]